MLSEVKAKEEGITWIDTPDITGALIHGNRSAIFLSDKWADEWRHQGSKRWCSERMTCRRSQQHSVHQHIQSSVDNPPTRKRKTEGRHRMPTSGVLQQNENRHRGRFQRKHRRPKPRKQRKQPTGRPGGLQRPFWSGETNNAGEELTQWLRAHNMCWISSFFNHNRRGTWYNKNHKSWHEIDGFCCRNKDRSRLVTKINTRNDITLTDHRPKQMTIRIRKIQQKPPGK